MVKLITRRMCNSFNPKVNVMFFILIKLVRIALDKTVRIDSRFWSKWQLVVLLSKGCQCILVGIAIYRKERSFRGRKVPSAEGRFLYGRKLLN